MSEIVSSGSFQCLWNGVLIYIYTYTYDHTIETHILTHVYKQICCVFKRKDINVLLHSMTEMHQSATVVASCLHRSSANKDTDVSNTIQAGQYLNNLPRQDSNASSIQSTDLRTFESHGWAEYAAVLSLIMSYTKVYLSCYSQSWGGMSFLNRRNGFGLTLTELPHSFAAYWQIAKNQEAEHSLFAKLWVASNMSQQRNHISRTACCSFLWPAIRRPMKSHKNIWERHAWLGTWRAFCWGRSQSDFSSSSFADFNRKYAQPPPEAPEAPICPRLIKIVQVDPSDPQRTCHRPIGKAGGKTAPSGTEISMPDVAPAFVEFLIITLKGQDPDLILESAGSWIFESRLQVDSDVKMLKDFTRCQKMSSDVKRCPWWKNWSLCDVVQ